MVFSWKQIVAPRRNTDIPEGLGQLMAKLILNNDKDVSPRPPKYSTLGKVVILQGNF